VNKINTVAVEGRIRPPGFSQRSRAVIMLPSMLCKVVEAIQENRKDNKENKRSIQSYILKTTCITT